jgi:hypothetical protein
LKDMPETMTRQAPVMSPNPACTPNISEPGKKRRIRGAWMMGSVAVGLLLAMIAAGTPWFYRLLVMLPTAGALVSWLQVRRNTCVMHAALGQFEHDDFTVSKRSDPEAAASRKVAATIYRDAALITLLVGVLIAATASL